MITAIKKFNWISIYIFVIFGVLFLWIGKSVIFGASGYPLIEEKPAQMITGRLKPIRLAVCSAVTLSGVSLEGTAITGVSNADRAMTAGITVYIDSPSAGMNFWIYNEDDTSESGNSLFVHFIDSGTSVYSDTECMAAVSKYIVSGTTLEKSLVLWSSEVSKWTVKTSGTPDVEAQ